MKQIIVTMRLVIFILYLTVTPMLIILCYIKDKSELESLLKSFITEIDYIVYASKLYGGKRVMEKLNQHYSNKLMS